MEAAEDAVEVRLECTVVGAVVGTPNTERYDFWESAGKCRARAALLRLGKEAGGKL